MLARIIKYRYMYGIVLGAFLLPLFVMVSCGNRSTAAIKEAEIQQAASISEEALNLITLVSPTNQQEFVSGEPVRIKIEYKTKSSPDSVQIWFAGQLHRTLRPDELVADISSDKTSSTGVKSLKLMAFKEAGRPQTITLFLTILSDIEPVKYGYSVENVFPHDVQAYTQGLVFHNGFLYEGTGQLGYSTLRKTEIETGLVIKRHNIESALFGEGIAIFQDRIFQLTWESKVGFIYDMETFDEKGKFYYKTEGWGLTTMGNKLVMSDGSNKLYIVEPGTFAFEKTIEVYDNNSMVVNLNELEFINGEIWANIYTTDLIARIDPSSGKILGYIDLVGLLSPKERINDGDHVLNGIAWDEKANRIFVTGKKWPKLFEIKVLRKQD